jgi:hypothetical protein
MTLCNHVCGTQNRRTRTSVGRTNAPRASVTVVSSHGGIFTDTLGGPGDGGPGGGGSSSAGTGLAGEHRPSVDVLAATATFFPPHKSAHGPKPALSPTKAQVERRRRWAGPPASDGDADGDNGVRVESKEDEATTKAEIERGLAHRQVGGSLWAGGASGVLCVCVCCGKQQSVTEGGEAG